ncbi:NfeD family protein [Sulfurovum sp. bin170]|uniref:NfeD family protein n=1 Tax=Sulfurovum sp. bin170 TaxID=2695268 RepID=UPI0013E06CEF|nr:NfeD family protein [Sulfurovum sp. bin170]NEW61525.1 NfeD family protein [Sulfurovum sp. bin170]
MLEFLTENLLWWHWIIFGILLITVEIFIGTFFMLGLGVAAIIVGAIVFFYPLTLEIELIIWMLLSLVSIAIWFKYLRDKSVENSGQSNYSLKTRGTIEEPISAYGRGKVKFDRPVLGNTIWHATANHDISLTSRVKIIEVKGQLIEVEEI